ncbi:hypothetical protein PV396_14145 [Streptomyces sp. ME02-8801-2C]|uniref:hypothetical protein n=1 Tax=Streptomyces sp. ME02-8801-2C TaxID=3028680 RepID=UPI0029AC9719|nr:hypothetical protein [Streptomyces sp. ME02-8801-2C]MDX3453079.1 hypothetical protein [Streptomyces sp. ME02-8801-2C]
MTEHAIYGTNAHTTSELVRLVSDLLEVTFTGRESDYRGAYDVADGPCGPIEIQPNAIPGDDDQDDLYAPEHPSVQVLLLTSTPGPDSDLHRRLSSIEGLAHLGHEAS